MTLTHSTITPRGLILGYLSSVLLYFVTLELHSLVWFYSSLCCGLAWWCGVSTVRCMEGEEREGALDAVSTRLPTGGTWKYVVGDCIFHAIVVPRRSWIRRLSRRYQYGDCAERITSKRTSKQGGVGR